MSASKFKYRAAWGLTYLILLTLLILFSQALIPKKISKEKDTPTLLATTDDLRAHHLAAIRGASRSVLLIIYSLTDGAIMQALQEKADCGIDVTVVCDAKASKGADKILKPNIKLTKIKGPGLMHQKSLVIDNRYVYLGSANMTFDSLRRQGNLVMQVDAKPLAEDLYQRAGCLIKNEATKSLCDYMMGEQKVILYHLPEEKGAAQKILKMLNTAKKTVRIAMFTWTREDFAEAVIEAHMRGVDAQVVIDKNSARGTSANIYHKLKNAGVPCKLNDGKALHHYKFCYIDNETLINGSANWTKAAFTKNIDCFLIFYNLTNEQKKKMEMVWKTIDST